jgi:(R)-2-hydroxyacyl-CoA dehydratese activating ATPase
LKVLGIDMGSRAVKIACFVDGKLDSTQVLSTMKFYRDNSRTVDGEIEVDLGSIGFEGIDKIVSTGYGRNNIKVAGATVINELKAHTYGAIYQSGLKDFTLVDIGGQDFKVIKVEKGIMVDMILNDKCAASSGRYLENMANIIEVRLEDMVLHYEDPVELNTTCAVFGETELIGKIAEGFGIPELSAGINYSLYKRIKPQIQKLKSKTTVLTGGVAQNKAVIEYIKRDFGEVVVPAEPQLNGAIGCGYFGIMKERKKDER